MTKKRGNGADVRQLVMMQIVDHRRSKKVKPLTSLSFEECAEFEDWHREVAEGYRELGQAIRLSLQPEDEGCSVIPFPMAEAQ
jgi:hypothetical protein